MLFRCSSDSLRADAAFFSASLVSENPGGRRGRSWRVHFSSLFPVFYESRRVVFFNLSFSMVNPSFLPTFLLFFNSGDAYLQRLSPDVLFG